MIRRNLTLNLPAELIRKTKIRASERGKSVNAFVTELLQETVSREDKTRAALDRLLAIGKRRPLIEGDPRSISRDQLHERR
jgi:plasmid stability protein